MINNNLKPVGFNLTINTKAQLYRIAAFLNVKRTHAVTELFEILFSKLVKDSNFKAFLDAYDRIDRTIEDRSSYTSFYISKKNMKKFENIMYDFGFIERSPFLRLIIDYVYNNIVKPTAEDSIERIRKDLGKLEYKIKSIGPILEGDIYIHVENPYS